MARETKTITTYTSDVTGSDITPTDEPNVVEIRIKYANKGGDIAVLDALDSDSLSGSVKDLMGKGRKEQPRGRKKS